MSDPIVEFWSKKLTDKFLKTCERNRAWGNGTPLAPQPETPIQGRHAMHHDLKLHPSFFTAKAEGIKPWEIRSTKDRTFAAGDTVTFHEHLDGKPTGRTFGPEKITFVLDGWHELMLPSTCIFTHEDPSLRSRIEKLREGILLARHEGCACDFHLYEMDADLLTDETLDRYESLVQERNRASNEAMSSLMLVASIREALGDHGKRMQAELLDYCRDLAGMPEQVRALEELSEAKDVLNGQLTAEGEALRGVLERIALMSCRCIDNGKPCPECTRIGREAPALAYRTLHPNWE